MIVISTTPPASRNYPHKIELCCINVQFERVFLRGATQKEKAERVGLSWGREELQQTTRCFHDNFHRMAFGLFHRFRIRDLLLSAVNDNARHHTGTQTLACAHGQQRGGFHFVVHDAHRLPLFHRTFETTNDAAREGVVTFLTRIEGVRRGGNANVSGRAHGFRRFNQRSRTFKIGDGRELHRRKVQARSVQTYRRGCDQHIAHVDMRLNSASGADTQESTNTQLRQFLYRNRGGRAANTGRADDDSFTIQLSTPGGEFAMRCQLNRLFHQRGDLFHTLRVARDDSQRSPL
ncbi:hypothetical protein CKO_00175 [Citrobacter koseri ATCC BAA-895]|uniref:Uncharacterized protein n=1 Tax=Citrobacter koseri (strain ATCC BAA-895 / CDC 4225-83 / SGSC4696) TaxID=290338 RepID=A8ACY0_CITK8|nr:hypothetical protein CKO_00175 [Citrobacter koseri ATCC BAA-895]